MLRSTRSSLVRVLLGATALSILGTTPTWAQSELEELGEAWFGLGVASWWQGDVTGSLDCWERAYAAFRRAGDNAQAVVAAFYLCLSYRMSLGNEVAANGWLRQAMALGATGGLPSRKEGSEMRPTCQSWQRMTPPFAWTASVILRQPATCSSDQMPGVSA